MVIEYQRALLGLLLLLSSASDSGIGTEPGAGIHEHAVRDHVVVRIAERQVQPERRTATPEQAIVWLNYASFPVRVSLRSAAATRMRCREPSHFQMSEAGRLASAVVPPQGSASLCLLDPGRYRYLVKELDPASASGTVVPGGRRLEGEIVVASGVEGEERGDSYDVASLARYHRAQADLYLQIAEVREDLVALYEADGLAEAAAGQRARAKQARSEAAQHVRAARRYEEARDEPR